MAKIISFSVTLFLIGLVNFGVALITNYHFFEVSAFVGMASVILIYFFSSSGGFTSRRLDMHVQGQTGIKMNKAEEKFSPSYAFYASLLYLIGSLIATFLAYREYFI